MGLEAALSTLESRLHALLEAVTDLHTTIGYWPPAQPPEAQEAPALVDIFSNSAEDLIGWTMEALAAANLGQAAARGGDYDGLRRGLAACHTQASNVTQRLLVDLMAYERVADLMWLGRTRGGEWRAWAMSVRQALDACRQPIFDLDQAQFACWQEVAEHGCRQMIAVHAIGFGAINGLPAPAESRAPLSGEL
jgi:hypothetical protein